MKITKEEKKQFDYLNDLRESGVTNMFGARPYLATKFQLDRKESSRVLALWMDNFNEDGYEDLVLIKEA